MRTYKSTQNETYACYGESSGFSTCQSTTWSREDAIRKTKGTFFSPKCELFRTCCEYRLPEENRKTLDFRKRNRVTMQARSGERWWKTLKDDAYSSSLFVPKHVTLSQKMRLALPVSIPASCFFDRQAICDRNSKGGIRGFPNWDWKISKQSLSISEHCKKTAHDTKWPCLFELFRSFLHFWPWWHQVSYFHARRGQICEFPTCSQWEVPACFYIP